MRLPVDVFSQLIDSDSLYGDENGEVLQDELSRVAEENPESGPLSESGPSEIPDDGVSLLSTWSRGEGSSEASDVAEQTRLRLENSCTTILSSADSQASTNNLTLNESNYVATSGAWRGFSDITSISTIESMSMEEWNRRQKYALPQNLTSEHVDDDSSGLSFRPSQVGSSDFGTDDEERSLTSPPSLSTELGISDSRPAFESFLNVGMSLGDQHPPSPPSARTSPVTELNTEETRFDEILNAVDEGPALRTLQLPPEPPVVPHHDSSDVDEVKALEMAGTILPSEFLCYLCKDVVVGATILSCGCINSAFCTSCLEAYGRNWRSSNESEGVASCPTCEYKNPNFVSSHALDIAIFNCVKSALAVFGEKGCNAVNKRLIITFQNRFYKRLAEWRNEIQQRQAKMIEERQTRRDLLLASLLDEEEEILRQAHVVKQPEPLCLAKTDANGWNFLYQFALIAGALLVASLGAQPSRTGRSGRPS